MQLDVEGQARSECPPQRRHGGLLIQLDIDRKSHMMEAGVFGPTQVGFAFDAVAHCDLLMRPLSG